MKMTSLKFSIIMVSAMVLISFENIVAHKMGGQTSLVDEEKFMKALEFVVNGTIPAESIKNKIYLFFNELNVAQQQQQHKLNYQTQNGTYRKHFLELIPVVRESESEQGLIRYRRSVCNKENENYDKQKRKLNDDKKRLLADHRRELEKLREKVCNDRCEFKCQQFSCPMQSCPPIPKNDSECAEPFPCPRNCDQKIIDFRRPKESSSNRMMTTKLRSSSTRRPRKKKVRLATLKPDKVDEDDPDDEKPSRSKKKEKPRIKTKRDTSFAQFNLENIRKIARADRRETRFNRVIAELDETSRRNYLETLKALGNSSNLKRETLVNLIDILSYLTRSNLTNFEKELIFDSSRVTSEGNNKRKSELLTLGMKIILGHVMPSDSLLSSKTIYEFSEEFPKIRQKRGAASTKIAEALDNGSDFYGCFICSDHCRSTFAKGCDFNCDNNKHCITYQCICRLGTG